MKLVCLSIILSFAASAETFQISGSLVNFENKNGLLIKGCEKDCLALKKIAEFKKINLKVARSDEKFFGSIGADVCHLVYKGESILGTIENKDQRAFCVFPDNSLVEINSLSQYLKDKKIVSE